MTAKGLRREIAADAAVDFPFWVRFFRDGTRWVAPEYGSEHRCRLLSDRLRALGFEPRMTGQPGTSGEWIIDI